MIQSRSVFHLNSLLIDKYMEALVPVYLYLEKLQWEIEMLNFDYLTMIWPLDKIK